MKRVRSWKFDAVIGVRGIRPRRKFKGIARKLTWIGIGKHEKKKQGKDGYPLLKFDHFWYKGEKGPPLAKIAPSLARRIYGRNVRVLKEGALTPRQQSEVNKLLARARKALPSGRHATLRNFSAATSKCQPICATRRKKLKRAVAAVGKELDLDYKDALQCTSKAIEAYNEAR